MRELNQSEVDYVAGGRQYFPLFPVPSPSWWFGAIMSTPSESMASMVSAELEIQVQAVQNS